jgi:CheY-like chemotaxis protein
MSKSAISVLIVDDDPMLRQLLSVVLSKSGYAVRSAHDGFSALAEIRTALPDILLSDLYMPEMSGFELLSVVRRRFPMIPVIAMSSAYLGPSVPLGIAADAFYTKATKMAMLTALMHELGNPELEIALKRAAKTAPVWVARKVDDSELTWISLACPDCLRTFFEIPEDTTSVIRETECRHCGTHLQYAMVQAASYGEGQTLALESHDPAEV